MNVFYLDPRPGDCAMMHCDKHVNKMIIEYAQILSTNHRILDGYETYETRVSEKTGKEYKVKQYKLDSELDSVLYKACHFNHPSTVWARQNSENYTWLYKLWYNLSQEYYWRYGKIHLTYEKLYRVLPQLPENIPQGEFFEPPPAMGKFPECIIPGDSLASYHKYYRVAKKSFAKWTRREIPEWFLLSD
jgi:hypothetical protein